MAKNYQLRVKTMAARGRKSRGAAGAGGGGGGSYISVTTPAAGTGAGGSSGGNIGTVSPGLPSDATTPVPSVAAWLIEASPKAVKINAGERPGTVGAAVTRIKDGRTERLKTDAALKDYGVGLWVSVDGGEWRQYVPGMTKALATQGGKVIALRSGAYLRTQGDDVYSGGVNNYIAFELRDLYDGKVYATATVPVVRDGEAGSPGEDGRMIYPAGSWSAEKTYDGTGGTLPVVERSGQYYLLRQGVTSQGSDPLSGDDWELFDRYSAVFADVLMANFAKLGGAVFYGDYMFSQDGAYNGAAVSGTDANGDAWYRRFTDGVTAGTFIPNYMVNFRTGEMRSFSGVFSGSLITLFVPADQSDAVTSITNKYKIGKQHRLISYGNGGLFVLPTDISFLGSRVMICDPRDTVTSASKLTVVQPETGYLLGNTTTTTDGTTLSRNIQFCCGVVELLAIPQVDRTGAISTTKCRWAILSFVAASSSSSDAKIDDDGDLILLPGIPISIKDPTIDPVEPLI